MLKEKVFGNRFTDLLLILYVVCTFAFNSNESYVKYIYVAMILFGFFSLAALMPTLTKIVIYKEIGLLIFYLLFGVLMSFFAVYSVDDALSRANTVFICLMSCLIITYYLVNRKNEDIIPISIAIGGLALAVYVLASYGGLSGYFSAAQQEGSRLGGEVGQVNEIGMYASYSFITMFYYVIAKKKYYVLVPMVFPFIVAMGSGSKKALFMCLFGCFVTMFLLRDKKSDFILRYTKYILSFFAVIVVCIIVIRLPFMNTVNKRMYDMFESYVYDDGDASTNIRREMIEAGKEAFPEHPFKGYGFNNSGYISLEIVGHKTYLHNDYIEQLVNVGIIGFLLFYGNIAFITIKFYSRYRKGDKSAVLPLMFVFIFVIISYGCVQYYGKMTYVFFAYWISTLYMGGEKTDEKEKHLQQDTLQIKKSI